jgi:serine/threonine protein kinase
MPYVIGCMENMLQSPRSLTTPYLQQNRQHERYENSKLAFILRQIGRQDRLRELVDAQVTDLWLPLPRRLAQRLLGDEVSHSFLAVQERCLDDDVKLRMNGEHLCLTDSYSLSFKKGRLLGVGGFGEVYQVFHPQTNLGYARKVMTRPVNFQRHCDLLRHFKKELKGLLRVRHQHCVRLAASCTDMDSVILFSSPVADCDLARFLDSELADHEFVILRRSIGCIVSALAYLHQADIRYRTWP